MSLRKHLRTNLPFFLFIVCLFAAPGLAPGCGKSKPPDGYLARVNDTYLTEQDLQRLSDSSPIPAQAKIEIAQTWVRNHLLFQEAEKSGLLKDEAFLSVLERNKEELAAHFLTEQILRKQNFTSTEAEQETYFAEHRQEFQLAEEGFSYSAAYFKSQEAAQEFRNQALRQGWKNAVAAARESKKIAMLEQDIFAFASQTYSAMQARLLALMGDEEISLVFSDDNSVFWVLQAGKSYKIGDIPAISVLRDRISARIIEKKKKEYMDGYIKGLYASNKVEINP
jgi:hypothetical protein